MSGRTMIPVLGSTVKAEAVRQVRARLHYYEDIHNAVLAAVDGAVTGTVRGMVRDYIDGLSDEAYKRFCQEVSRAA